MTTLAVHAADLKVEARLIWGANDEKENVKFEPLDPALSDKLHRMFKWKNYYEVTNKTAGVPLNKSSDLKMSDTCTIQVKNLGASRIEVSWSLAATAPTTPPGLSVCGQLIRTRSIRRRRSPRIDGLLSCLHPGLMIVISGFPELQAVAFVPQIGKHQIKPKQPAKL